MIIITSGNKYLDIDGYASAIAYRELFKLRNIDAKFVSFAPLNNSITKSLVNLDFGVDKYEIKPDDNYIILDLSDKEYFEDFVVEDRIIELIDHHTGFENYWQEKIGKKSIIEPIGSVATIIVEKYEEYNLLQKMSKDITKLLMAAILDNTLNFTAKITKIRDINAYQKLKQLSGLTNFKEEYFNECQKQIENDLESTIRNDIKSGVINKFLPRIMGQLTIWDKDNIFKEESKIQNILNTYGQDWLINIISIKDNKSYIMCSNNKVKDMVCLLFLTKSNSNIVEIEPSVLRKEIIKKALDLESMVN